MKTSLISALSLALITCLLPTQAAWALRCDGKIIKNQQTAAEVLRLCGEPDLRDELVNAYGRLVQQQWYYNFGPRRLLHILTLRQGRLVRIDTDGYGFIETAQGGNCRPHEITTGMNKLLLLHKCGEPEQTTVYSGYSLHDHFDHHDHPPASLIKREEWFYNFGPRHLRRTVILENGRVSHIQTEGYGD